MVIFSHIWVRLQHQSSDEDLEMLKTSLIPAVCQCLGMTCNTLSLYMCVCVYVLIYYRNKADIVSSISNSNNV